MFDEGVVRMWWGCLSEGVLVRVLNWRCFLLPVFSVIWVWPLVGAASVIQVWPL